jgi:hypothetical protein
MMQMIDEVEAILSGDLQRFAKIQTNGTCNCNDYCFREGVCRSFQITDIEIQQVDINSISTHVWEKVNNTKSLDFKRNENLKFLLEGYNTKIDAYCLERILTINKIFKTENWHWSYSNGYYGHEIDSLKLNADILQDVITHFRNVVSLQSLKEKVEYILKLEYGFILDSIKDCEFEITIIKTSDLVFPQKTHLEKVKKAAIYKGLKKDNILGVCFFDGKQYKIIDGYNRLSQVTSKRVTIIKAFKK